MTDTFKVEKGVNMPPVFKTIYPWKDMVAGDSFLVEKRENENSQRSSLYASAKYHGVKISIRADGDSLRVWRVE